MELNLVVEGLKFMVLGMSTVFLFLMLMVWILQIQSAIVTKFFPPKSISKPATFTKLSSAKLEDSTHIAVITAAIQMFRQQQNN